MPYSPHITLLQIPTRDALKIAIDKVMHIAHTVSDKSTEIMVAL